ncbi:Eco29kI family restriction endonuclease [Agrobacterium pusense]|uniref:Eco29kI family restriction endonuclease n=1 Tax=Agrobacterium TaxID=357 RepID=UPI000D38E73E|nr:Eco29kI family restriction endonuclease [Agrobacterium pusense]PTV72489.1 restriction endonuclease [Agrobacterium pusense]
MTSGPYNPLDKFNLARSIEIELLSREAVGFDQLNDVRGAGVYAIYYVGDFPAYRAIAAKNIEGKFGQPIYVGKAIPKGGRKGGISADASAGKPLVDRLAQHASSIDQAENLSISDFAVRHLVVDDIWIPLGENMLIETYKPVWNRALDGFGNKDPGRRRATQYKSPWDVLHPGRRFAEKLADSGLSTEFLAERVDDYLHGRAMKRLPRVVEDQQAAEQGEAEERADNV